jgi:hypothetical protein
MNIVDIIWAMLVLQYSPKQMKNTFDNYGLVVTLAKIKVDNVFVCGVTIKNANSKFISVGCGESLKEAFINGLRNMVIFYGDVQSADVKNVIMRGFSESVSISDGFVFSQFFAPSAQSILKG